MEEPITKKELIEKLKELTKTLSQLEANKSPASSVQRSESNSLEYLKATEDLKKRIEIKGLIRKYEYMLMKYSYVQGTEPFVEDLTDFSKLPEFSWGIHEKDKPDREVIFEQSNPGQEYLRVINYGRFEYLTGESGVHIEDIPDTGYVTIDVEHFLKCGDKVRIQANDIKEAIIKHPEYIGERLNFLRITKGLGESQRDYFILSPIQQHQLEDEAVRRFFVNEYCSDLYLDSVTTGENGIYAGNIDKDEEGFCEIKYSKSSVRAAKLAELLRGSTLLHLNFSNETSQNLPGAMETFKQIRNRFFAEILKERQASGIKGDEQK